MGKYPFRGIRYFVAALSIGLACLGVSRSASAQDPAATFDAADMIPDGTALLPLNDWMPLFQFTITAADLADPPVGEARRILARLDFILQNDPTANDYNVLDVLRQSDLLEFAIFREGGDPEERGVLDEFDSIVVGRAATGHTNVPLIFDPDGVLTSAPFTNLDDDPSAFGFSLGGDITAFRDFIQVEAATTQEFIVAIRTSPTWRNGITLAYQWNPAPHVPGDPTTWELLNPDGSIPLDTGTPPANPDSYPDEPLNPETAYSSSFAAFDSSSAPSVGNPISYSSESPNAWAYPRHLYTPFAENSRPRDDVSPEGFGSRIFDFVEGEYLDLRRLLSLDNWAPLIGIDLQGGNSVDSSGSTKPRILREVNVILTDIGGDPDGQQGNGGFNPAQGLESFTDLAQSIGGDFDGDTAIGRDFSFNGLWVFFDTNGNGAFDQPVPLEGGGVSFVDHPMFPEGTFDQFGLPELPDERNPGIAQWEYLPFPPDGGDPWWKIRLRFSFLGRRQDLPLPPDTDPDGWLRTTPNGGPDDDEEPAGTSSHCDYFVVVRPDSGYEDTQTLPGDGVGLTYGADFRAFIEPRRFNPNTGHQDGGIHVYSQIAVDSFVVEGEYLGGAWQDDARWLPTEPWWPSRTLNQTNAKPVRSTVEIHDLVLTYESSNLFSRISDIGYGRGPLYLGDGAFGGTSTFSKWLDPNGLTAGLFQDTHPVGVFGWVVNSTGVDDHLYNSNQFAYETVPFFHPDIDLPPFGPRSNFLPVPANQPTLPDYSTWPALLGPDEFPNELQWAPADNRARLLKQHIEISSEATALIGLNFAAVDDPIVNKNTIFVTPDPFDDILVPLVSLQQVTVAFWGPDFDPSDLLPVVQNGVGGGVSLIEDGVQDSSSTTIPLVYGGQNGVFGGPDTPVPVQGLKWRTAPELIDIDGDGNADDMDLDGSITDADKAWVLQLRPAAPWPLPARDAAGGYFPTGQVSPSKQQSGNSQSSEAEDVTPHERVLVPDHTAVEDIPQPAAKGKGAQANSKQLNPHSKKQPVQISDDDIAAGDFPAGQAKALGQKAFGLNGNGGDDLFVVVRTSDKLTRFEQFRCVVPTRLPERGGQIAGVQLNPQAPISLAVYDKTHPEETVFPFYGSQEFGHDLIEANIGVKYKDQATQVLVESDATSVFAFDISTNRGNAGIAAEGNNGVGDKAEFIVTGAGWTSGAFAGYYLIDSNYEQWDIITNNSQRLTLDAPSNASGTPKSGPWKIVKDPSFLEQLIVEFIDYVTPRVGDTVPANPPGFSILNDLLQLDIDPTVSGIALYRDNDFDPANTNGQFDEGDIPVQLDYAPFLVGQAGEVANQVMFVFSTPGTDGIPIPRKQQTRHRQWVPDKFGSGADPENGADFFVVVRTSDDADPGDDFRVSIVPWGPNTPSEPDPDTFPPPPAARTGEFDVFSEFPWGQRALGFITVFNEGVYYRQYPVEDNSGVNWVRTTAATKGLSPVISVVADVSNPDDLLITDVAPDTLPKTITGDGITLIITGQNFGNNPAVDLDGLALTILASSNSSITAVIPATTLDSDNDGEVSLRVRNPANGDFDRYNGLEIDTSGTGGGTAPTITSVSPNEGTKNDFPVTITGTNFVNPTVKFEGINMPIQGTPTSTKIVVGFPASGISVTGPLDVTVRNEGGLIAVKPDGFKYINTPGGGGGGGGGGFGSGGGLPVGGCFIATAAYGSPFSAHLDSFRGFRDGVLLKTAPGTALVEAYYTMSPAMADRLAEHPALALLVRVVLTPLAWAIEAPLFAVIALFAAVGGGMALRTRRVSVRARRLN